ncbi:MAG TPA: hypothetical protein VFG04_05615 [Planctomycetaceae bacterium]|nr:hypothetical protein [Planctomycetaceae bacterium]
MRKMDCISRRAIGVLITLVTTTVAPMPNKAVFGQQAQVGPSYAKTELKVDEVYLPVERIAPTAGHGAPAGAALATSPMGRREVAAYAKSTLDIEDTTVDEAASIRIGNRGYYNFRVVHSGVPLARISSIALMTGKDNEVLLSRRRNMPSKYTTAEPSIAEAAARQTASGDFQQRTKQGKAQIRDASRVYWRDSEGTGRLCWSITIENGSLEDPCAAMYYIDATRDGSIVHTQNLIHFDHTGFARGDVWASTPLQPSAQLPLGFLEVNRVGNGGGAVPSSMQGRYDFQPGNGSVQINGTLRGPFCVISDQSATPIVNAAGSGNQSADINLNLAATQTAQLAQTSAFYWINVAHDFASAYLLPSHLHAIPTRVNINQSCNAFFSSADVSINFFHGGNGCQNTAYSDVVVHEYGHGIDHSFGGIHPGADGEVGGSAYSEGFGDALAALVTRQPLVGRDFQGAGTSLRDARTVVTYPQPAGTDAHLYGQVYSGFVWEFVQELRKCDSDDSAFETAKAIVLASAFLDPSNIRDAIRLAFVVDDDDNDLTNGTPHFKQLAHAADSRKIPRPADPSTSAQPRYVYRGGNGEHHLIIDTGTAGYCWPSAALAGSPNTDWLTRLQFSSADTNYWYFCEAEFPGYKWAFGKDAGYDGLFDVYFLPNGENGHKWVLFQRAKRLELVNATAAGFNSRK